MRGALILAEVRLGSLSVSRQRRRLDADDVHAHRLARPCRVAQRIVHALWIPLLLGVVYILAFALNPDTSEGGSFSSLQGVMQLFTSPFAVLAGWVHYLVFDLFVGAWEVRDARRREGATTANVTTARQQMVLQGEHPVDGEDGFPSRYGPVEPLPNHPLPAPDDSTCVPWVCDDHDWDTNQRYEGEQWWRYRLEYWNPYEVYL